MLRYASQPMARRILFSLLFLALVGALHAQVTVNIKLPRRNFLAGESVPVDISISNLSGQDLVFQGTTLQPWIDFIAESSRGVPLSPVGKTAFGSVKVPAGKTVGRNLDLSQIFNFTELGNYSLYAVIRLPNQRTGGFQSNRTLFTVATAKPYWSQVVGVPGKSGQVREFRLIQFSADEKTRLYAQLADEKTGRILRTHHLGEILNLRKPTVTVDTALNMHVLYMVNPSFWSHARVSPAGDYIGRDLYKPDPTGGPRLARMDDGAVKVVGGYYYDPEKEAERRNSQRKASDRPGFIYE